MDTLRTSLEQQSLLSMFLVIGLGSAIGSVNIRGFALGIGAVLFVGLGVGMLAPQAAPPSLLSSLGCGSDKKLSETSRASETPQPPPTPLGSQFGVDRFRSPTRLYSVVWVVAVILGLSGRTVPERD